MTNSRNIPAVLTIAGSDSSGGAGVQADLRTFNAFKVYGCSVITAITSQNPFEVRRVDTLPSASVACQLETVLEAFPIRFAKTGMLVNREIIRAVAEVCRTRKLELVIDPVMVSTSGVRLLEAAAVAVMTEELFPLAAWITPNIPEAELICRRKISAFPELLAAAKELNSRYGCNVILKGGHLSSGELSSDAVCCEGKLYAAASPLLPISGNVSHGTGCTLSAALAANLALGKSWTQALVQAKAFVYGSLAEAAVLNNPLCQMYPPEKNYSEQIILTPFK